MPELLIYVLLPFLLAGLLCALPAGLRAYGAAMATLLCAVLFGLFATALPTVGAGGAVVQSMPWLPSHGVELALRLDGLSMLFALLITGIGAFIFLYVGRYLAGSAMLTRCVVLLLLFMGAMLGSVLADDVVMLFVFWELTSLMSFLLIGFDGKEAKGRAAALQSLLVTGGGGLALLAGLLLLGNVVGTFRISEMIAATPLVLESPLLPAIVLLILGGAFTKSAQFPFHFWLPNAMAAPTPVSAYLHSATMVKLGVYLMARFTPLFGEDPLWTGALLTAGSITMLLGCALALRERDLKRILAYTTVVGLGTLTMLLGIGGEVAALAAVIFLVVHALYKACLFLVAGAIDKATGTRDITRLGKLARAMPVTACAAILAGVSMAGLPPLVGFLGKELVYEAALDGSAVIVVVALLTNAATVAAAGVLVYRPMFGPGHPLPKAPKEVYLSLYAGPIVLAVLGLLCGLMPALMLGPLASAAAAAIGGQDYVLIDLYLWHGFTPMLLLSVVTVALGLLIFRFADRWRRTELPGVASAEGVYGTLLEGMQRLAVWQTRRLQTGSLRGYMRAVFAVIVVTIGGAMLVFDGLALPDDVLAPRLLDVMVIALVLLGAVATALLSSLLAGVAAVGLVGFGVALIFLLFGAPDLAFTQFAVETLFLVILTVLLLHLPHREPEHRSRSQRLADGTVAIGVGTVACLLLLAVLSQPFDRSVTAFYETVSLPIAHGKNIVNVILVDFRALDTLGEIAVLGFAGLALAALLRVTRGNGETERSADR